MIRRLNDELEKLVEERTLQLQQVHNQVLSQIAERERTEEQLRHMQKIESIGELTGGVAHDFNNLLTAGIGNLELLTRRVPPNPSIDRLIDGAMQGAQRGAALTQRLLAFARRQTLEPRPIDLAELVRGMDDLLKRSIGPAVEMQVDLPSSLPPACVDANQIELALLNLAINARDAMPDGGTLTIETRDLTLKAPPPGVSEFVPGDYVGLHVRDTGEGMSDAVRERALDPFFTTKPLGKGTGLGLSMTFGYVRQSNGFLVIEIAPGKGTKVTILMPRHSEDRA